MSTSKNSTISSSLLRQRDQKILEKHEKEIKELEWKLQKLKHISDDRTKELFDAVHRGNRLSHSLGFEDIYTAQVFIDSVDYEISFKDCVGRLNVLQAELLCEKKEVAVLQARLSMVEDDATLRDELAKSQAELRDFKRIQNEEIKVLQKRYDSLKAVKERAAQRYKADYKKWRDFSKWLFAENDQHRTHRNERGISKAEKKRRDLASVMRKRQKMAQIGPNIAQFEGEPEDTENHETSCHPPPIGGVEPDEDKENSQPSPPRPKRLYKTDGFESLSTDGSPLKPLRDIQLPTDNPGPPSSSPNVFVTPDVGLRGSLQANAIHPGSERIPRQRSHASEKVHLHSSDREDDSQVVFVSSTNPRSGTTAVFKVPAPLPTLGGQQVEAPDSVRRGLDFTSVQPDYRPSKIRRIGGDEVVGPLCQADSTPCPSKSRRKSESKVSPDADDLQRADDYSIFKGRGRYAGQNQAADQTINGLYMIDPAKNDGKGYQYDEVVRSKEVRKKMHTTDCECCREYYENVGPLPKRLKQPLWRSPSRMSSEPHSQSDRLQTKSGASKDDVDAHRQTISRHRHTWARAKTPPGYWEIGFPTTQEVGAINDKAKEMQRRKLAEIATEASKGTGRYQKK